jgi:hypothetical protein
MQQCRNARMHDGGNHGAFVHSCIRAFVHF